MFMKRAEKILVIDELLSFLEKSDDSAYAPPVT